MITGPLKWKREAEKDVRVRERFECYTAVFEGEERSYEPVGAQGRPPQSTPQRHIDDFELKLLKKQPMQEGYSDPPFCLPKSRK